MKHNTIFIEPDGHISNIVEHYTVVRLPLGTKSGLKQNVPLQCKKGNSVYERSRIISLDICGRLEVVDNGSQCASLEWNVSNLSKFKIKLLKLFNFMLTKNGRSTEIGNFPTV